MSKPPIQPKVTPVGRSKMKSSRLVRTALAMTVTFGLAVVAWWYFRSALLRNDVLGVALSPLIADGTSDKSLVARVIWESYLETRSSASIWSGVCWGFTFSAAVLSASAALVLKFETPVQNEATKKNAAAILSVVAALLITLSTSGDFQRKWHANRTAAALLERTGYEFLENNGENPRTYLASVGQILLNRSLAIVGTTENPIGVEQADKAGASKE